MRRSDFIGTTLGRGLLHTTSATRVLSNSPNQTFATDAQSASGHPSMALGLFIKPTHGRETTFARAKQLESPARLSRSTTSATSQRASRSNYKAYLIKAVIVATRATSDVGSAAAKQ